MAQSGHGLVHHTRPLLGAKRTEAGYLTAILYADADVNRYDIVSLASGRR